MSSISFQTLDLKKASWLSPCIVVGRVLETGSYRFLGSKEYEAQPEGASLQFIRVSLVKILKEGRPELSREMELRIFDSGQWFQHTHAALIRDGVISYAEFHYAGGLSNDELRAGTAALFFLRADSCPAGFPTGSMFLSYGGAHDRADREPEVAAALQEGRPEEFDCVVRLRGHDLVRFPDGLKLKYLGHSHKRPRIGGPQKEWIDVELSLDGKNEILALAHHTSVKRVETWETKSWGPYSIEAKAMDTQDAVIVVRKPGTK